MVITFIKWSLPSLFCAKQVFAPLCCCLIMPGSTNLLTLHSMLGKANITHLKDIRKGLMKERLIEYLSDDTSLAKEPKLPPSTVAKIAKPGKSAAAAPGTTKTQTGGSD